MKVVNNFCQPINRFGELAPGDVFLLRDHSETWMKIAAIEHINCVRLTDGAQGSLFDTAEIIRVNAEVILT